MKQNTCADLEYQPMTNMANHPQSRTLSCSIIGSDVQCGSEELSFPSKHLPFSKHADTLALWL